MAEWISERLRSEHYSPGKDDVVLMLRRQRRLESRRWRNGKLKSPTDQDRHSPPDRERTEQGTDGQEDLIEAAR
jgi:hypothetical protein